MELTDIQYGVTVGRLSSLQCVPHRWRVCNLTMLMSDWRSISRDCIVLLTVFTSVLLVCRVSVLVMTSLLRVSDCKIAATRGHGEEELRECNVTKSGSVATVRMDRSVT